MRNIRSIFASLLATFLLVACGGGGSGGGQPKVQFSSTVSFGDSFSDVGTYKVGTIAALGGGKFTVNGNGGTVWTEVLATSLNTPAQCAARTGLLPNIAAVTGATVMDFPNCYNYAQGSSRVTSSGTGPSGVALQQYGQQNIGYMADSLNEQFNRHLSKIGGKYSGSELVTINGGGNDLLMQLYGVSNAAGGGAAAVTFGTIAGWSQATINVVSGGGSVATSAAVVAAVASMAQVGTELAGYIKSLVVGKGAKYVLVRNLADLSITPFGISLDTGNRDVITKMIQAFNFQLKSGLDGTSGVILLDDYALSADSVANPSKYGYSNVKDQSCGPNPLMSVLVCNTTNLIPGDTSRFAFADDVHPTPYAHRKEAESALALMVSAGWH